MVTGWGRSRVPSGLWRRVSWWIFIYVSKSISSSFWRRKWASATTSLGNMDKCLPDYTVSHPRRQLCSHFPMFQEPNTRKQTPRQQPPVGRHWVADSQGHRFREHAHPVLQHRASCPGIPNWVSEPESGTREDPHGTGSGQGTYGLLELLAVRWEPKYGDSCVPRLNNRTGHSKRKHKMGFWCFVWVYESRLLHLLFSGLNYSGGGCSTLGWCKVFNFNYLIICNIRNIATNVLTYLFMKVFCHIWVRSCSNVMLCVFFLL
jgi:hypothetical protein